MGYWLKLYTDVLDDPKYFRLSEEAKLGMYELMLVAKKVENGEMTGNLPPIDEIAFHTRKTSEHWEKIMPELEAIGFVVIERDIPKVKNYVKRQGAIPSETRVKQYRKKRNDGVMGDVTELKRECNELVTNRNGDKNKNKKQIRKETEEELINTPNIYSRFQSIVGSLFSTGEERDYFNQLLEDYGEEQILRSAKWLSEQESRPYRMIPVLKSIDTSSKNWTEINKPKHQNEGLAWLESELAKSEEVTNG